jgi:DNA (cytosine-5)-methyltransferase 1
MKAPRMINTIDLFAGCGGLTEGFKLSGGYNYIAGVEWDINALNTLRERLRSKWKYHSADDIVLHFDIQRTDELLFGFNDDIYGKSDGLVNLAKGNSVDVVIGGPPCQAYSIAGRIRDKNGMHDDYRNYLFESYMSVVNHFRPKACIFENVPGMLSACPGGVSIVERVREAFDEAGYIISDNLKDEALFDVSDFGVPQKRKRVIIAAFCKKTYKEPKQEIANFYRHLNACKVENKLTVQDALSDLPPIFPMSEPGLRQSHSITHTPEFIISDHNPRFHNERDIEIFRLLASDIESGKEEYTSAKALHVLYTEKTGKSSSVHKYHVLRKDKPSNTIPAHLYKDGLRHIHPDSKQARSITVREAARLQSFEDDYNFLGGNGAKYKMIGNAVPPVFANSIANSLKATLLNANEIK